MSARFPFGRLLLASGAAALSAACSLVAGFDGFVGPGEEADTSPSVSDVTPSDGGGGRAETSTQAEASIDAGADSEVPNPNVPPIFVDGGTWCGEQTGTTFCDDFDTSELTKRWMKEGAFAKLTSYSPKSAPNDLVVDVPAATGGGTFVSKITHDLEGPSTNLVVSFDFMPEKVYVGTSFMIMGALEYTKGAAKYSLRLVYSSGAIRLEESDITNNSNDRYHPFFEVPVGKWSRIKLDVVTSGATPGVQIYLDNTPVGARETITPTPSMDPLPTLILGAVFAGNPHTGWALRYDNVSVSYR